MNPPKDRILPQVVLCREPHHARGLAHNRDSVCQAVAVVGAQHRALPGRGYCLRIVHLDTDNKPAGPVGPHQQKTKMDLVTRIGRTSVHHLHHLYLCTQEYGIWNTVTYIFHVFQRVPSLTTGRLRMRLLVLLSRKIKGVIHEGGAGGGASRAGMAVALVGGRVGRRREVNAFIASASRRILAKGSRAASTCMATKKSRTQLCCQFSLTHACINLGFLQYCSSLLAVLWASVSCTQPPGIQTTAPNSRAGEFAPHRTHSDLRGVCARISACSAAKIHVTATQYPAPKLRQCCARDYHDMGINCILGSHARASPRGPDREQHPPVAVQDTTGTVRARAYYRMPISYICTCKFTSVLPHNSM